MTFVHSLSLLTYRRQNFILYPNSVSWCLSSGRSFDFNFNLEWLSVYCAAVAAVAAAVVVFFSLMYCEQCSSNESNRASHHNLTARSDWTGFYLILLNFHASRLSRSLRFGSGLRQQHTTKTVFFLFRHSTHTQYYHHSGCIWLCLCMSTALCMFEQIISMCVSNYRREFQRQVYFFFSSLLLAFYFLYSITLIRCIWYVVAITPKKKVYTRQIWNGYFRTRQTIRVSSPFCNLIINFLAWRRQQREKKQTK